MTDQAEAKQQVVDEINIRKNIRHKKYHSESSLQQYGDEDGEGSAEECESKDPGVQNKSLSDLSQMTEENRARKRAVSQPGPSAGSIRTATATRAARRKPTRNVMYAPELEDFNDREYNGVIYRGNEFSAATPIIITGDRNSPISYIGQNGMYKNGDTKSLSNYRLYISANDLRGNATPRKRSIATMDAQSLRSIETHAPPPTSLEDNTRITREYLSAVMSAIYAVLLVTLGIIFYLGDSFVEYQVSLIYSIILSSVGFLYVIYLMYDISRYKSIALKNQRIKDLHEEKISDFFRKQEEEFGPSDSAAPGDRTPDVFRPANVPAPVLIPLKHQYCFSTGRHSGSFYLKMGAAGFAIGHLVHSVLLIAVQLAYLFDAEISNDDCLVPLQIVLDVLFPVYCFLQLYFIFKYSNVIILRGQVLARFAFMHMIGSSLCFWVSAIVRETTLYLTIYANSVYGNGAYGNADVSKKDTDTVSVQNVNRFLDVSNLYNENCTVSRAIDSIVENFSPYLFPFSVEFNILIVAIYYIIWSNIGNCENDNASSESVSTLDEQLTCKIPTANEDNDFTSNIVIHADCHASNRGLFAGIILLVSVIGVLIIGFVFSSVGGDFLELGYMLNDCLKLGLHSVMLVATVFTFNQLRKLDINAHSMSMLDDVLLFICLPAFFMETVFSMIATINILNIIKSIDVIVMVMQVVIQTPLIMDGLRRCSNNKKLRRSKPGRELLMFLLIANVSMWLFNTFSYKSPESLDERYEFYGKVLWTILGHISLPLIMFYRFHSSVCFADIWDSAYKPGEDH